MPEKENIYELKVGPYFSISEGYKLIKNDKINALSYSFCFYKESESQLLKRTEYEIVLRASRTGLSLFLQAFINLFLQNYLDYDCIL